MNPRVSIIISAYNDAKYLGKCLDSVISQTFKDWELLLVDDGSTDNTKEVLKRYKDSRIQTEYNNSDVGVVPNLNKMLNKASGEYIARLDSDDFWSDNFKLEKQVRFLKNNPDYVLVGCWAKVVDLNGRIQSKIKYPVDNESLKKIILSKNPFVNSSVIFRKRVLSKVGLYLEGMSLIEDYSMWLRIGTRGKIFNLPEELISYRINPAGSTQNNYSNQMIKSLNLIRGFKQNYPYSRLNDFIWVIRRYYPKGLREMFFSMQNKTL